MATCVFCGHRSSKNSDEHVLAKSVILRMNRKAEEVARGHILGESRTFEAPESLWEYTTRSVCPPCNNGWMNELEKWFVANLGPLLEPSWPALSASFFQIALREKVKLARWGLKTALMADAKSLKQMISDKELTETLFHSRLPDSFFVQAGYIDSPGLEIRINKGFPVQNGGRGFEWQEHREGKAFQAILHLNHLGLRFMRSPEAHPVYAVTNHRRALRCFPDTDDPHAVDYRFHTFMEFATGVALTTHG